MKTIALILSMCFCLNTSAQIVRKPLSTLDLKDSNFFTKESAVLRMVLIKEYKLNKPDTTYYVKYGFVNAKTKPVQKGYNSSKDKIDISPDFTTNRWKSNYEMPISEFAAFYKELSNGYSYALSHEVEDASILIESSDIKVIIDKYEEVEYKVSLDKNTIKLDQDKMVKWIKELKKIEKIRLGLAESGRL